MKILFFTDAHLRSQSDRPKWRIDDHYITQFEELNEITALAKKYSVDLLLSGGDFFHHPSGSHALLTDVMNWTKNLPCPFFSVTGNHDCHGYVVDDKNTGLSVLFESGMIGDLSLRDLIWENEKVIIKGVDAFLDPRKGNYLFEEKFNDYYKIIVSHNFIIPHQVPFDSVLPSQVNTNSDLILLGHYHQHFDHVEKSVKFVNPGSLSRWAINEQHQPEVLLIDTTTQTVLKIPLSCSKSANEVFDLQSANEMQAKEMNLQEFVDSLENASFENIDLETMVYQEGQKQNIITEVVDLALIKIQQAKVELK